MNKKFLKLQLHIYNKPIEKQVQSTLILIFDLIL